MSEKICPIIKAGQDANSGEEVYHTGANLCLKEKCALWVKEHNKILKSPNDVPFDFLIEAHCGLIKGE